MPAPATAIFAPIFLFCLFVRAIETFQKKDWNAKPTRA
jgi:hypothetical protein